MASTALNKEEIQEYYDTENIIREKAKVLAELIKQSKHAVIHTGAGLSTAAGIADFRGPNGVWTLRAKGEKPIAQNHFKMPTVAHMAIKKLVDENLVKFVVSQNIDGLHLRSKLPVEKISELHGNYYKEVCKSCRKVYFRNYHTRNATKVHDHATGRKCENCKGELYDSIINFGESLPEDQFEKATIECKEADLCIIFGTSLRVSPACHLPMMMNNGGRLVICNLQKTPFDDKPNSLVIHAKCDDLLKLVMENLNIEIPDFIFEFSFKVQLITKKLLITDSSIQLNTILKKVTLIDSKMKEYDLIPSGTSTRLEKILTNYEKGDEIRMKLTFNLLNSFTENLILTKIPSNVLIQLNITKKTMDFKLN